ncbi:hypothetical protein KKA50_00575 [Patescibacteria group bacterium]|nr:hypothetical protein [Patescibacteria group bacterium]
MGERVFHIISNKRKCWNTIKICTKEGILFYFREVKKNDETSLSYIKQEPAFPKKPRKQQRYEGEELQIIPSLVGLSPSIFMEDLNW